MRWMTIPAVGGQDALHAPPTPRNLNPKDRRRKRRRGRRKKRRKQKRQERGLEKVETGRRSRAAGTVEWRRKRSRSGTWAWGSTPTRLYSSSFAWAPVSLRGRTTTWHWRRYWTMARCPDAPPARSATTRAAGRTATSRFPSWTPRPRGGPSSRYQPPAACAWAEGVQTGEGDEDGCHPSGTQRRHRGHCNTLTAEDVTEATCWLPVVRFLFKEESSGPSWFISLHGFGLDSMLPLQQVSCFQRNSWHNRDAVCEHDCSLTQNMGTTRRPTPRRYTGQTQLKVWCCVYTLMHKRKTENNHHSSSQWSSSAPKQFVPHINTGITSYHVQVNSAKWMPCIFMYYCMKVKYIYFW